MNKISTKIKIYYPYLRRLDINNKLLYFNLKFFTKNIEKYLINFENFKVYYFIITAFI